MKNKKLNQKNYIQKALFIFFVILLSGYLICIYMNIEVDKYYGTENEVYEKNEIKNKKNVENIEDLIKKNSKCVVGISKLKNNGITRLIEGGTEALELGTGIIVSEDGYILTNQHIAGNKYGQCHITLYDGREFDANVVWASEELDLAIIKIKVHNFEYAILGNSNEIDIGENVYAIGNPVGIEFQRTVTAGIISGLNRTVKIAEEERYMEGLIQTDCAINRGNSGGPLINDNGEVIGINTIKITSADGLGLAIPINTAKVIIKKIKENSNYEEPTMGILAYDREAEPYIEYDLKMNYGVYVADINYDGPAFKSGILKKDIITQVDEQKIYNINDLRLYILEKNVGETVSVKIKRKNKDISFDIRLEKKY